MNAITISETAPLTTVISTFTTEPVNQRDVLELLIGNATTFLSKQDGFVSCSFHLSEDGTRIVNYAQWRDAAAIEAMLADPAAREGMAAVRGFATIEAERYTVAFTREGK